MVTYMHSGNVFYNRVSRFPTRVEKAFVGKMRKPVVLKFFFPYQFKK